MMIDAHHHLWKYSAAEYGWITPQMPASSGISCRSTWKS
jgi:predicted TIM-barrel fold metal-dependent hydrolase